MIVVRNGKERKAPRLPTSTFVRIPRRRAELYVFDGKLVGLRLGGACEAFDAPDVFTTLTNSDIRDWIKEIAGV